VYFVTWLDNDNAVQQLSDNVFLYNLAQMRGSDTVLSRIPSDCGGVYTWYRRFHLEVNDRDDPEKFTKFILDELSKLHSAPREIRLPPAHKITLQAETLFSKDTLLRELSMDSSFRQLLFTLLNNSLIFQQPLYIGKATNLYSRIYSHLREGSILRKRLKDAGHNLNHCKLLLILTSKTETDTCSIQLDSDHEIDDEMLEKYEFSETASEQLIEDILSRLFLPLFTLRYG
jgi:hypothetical protein